MSDRRGLIGLALPTWLLASCATAALAHACIGLLGEAGIGGNRYAEHAHAAVVPVALAALSLAAALLLRSALRALGHSNTSEPLAEIGRHCAELGTLAPSIAVALGGIATLLAMEFAEQRSVFGSVAGMSDALGGNPVLGLAIVAIVAALVTIVGLRSARVLLAGTIAAVGALYFWIVAEKRARSCAAILRRVRHDTDLRAPAFFARCFGMRAPPLPALV